MRLKLIIVAIMIASGLLLASVNKALAQCPGGCQVYQCGEQCYPDPNDPEGSSVCTPIFCDPCSGTCEVRLCGPGEYWAGGQCHDYAGGEEPPPNTRECTGGEWRVNCPPNQVISDALLNIVPVGPQAIANCGLGSAQRIIGDEYDGETNEYLYTNVGTYQCGPICGAGYTLDCPLVNGPITYVNNSCFNPTNCTSVGTNSTYLSHYSSPSAGTCYCNCPEGERCGSSCSDGTNWIYNVVTACQESHYECTCVSTCSAAAASGLNYDGVANRISWTPGQNGSSQELYVSATEADVYNGCGAGTNCVANVTFPNPTTSGYTFSSALAGGTRYHTMLINFQTSDCVQPYAAYFDTPAVTANAWWQTAGGSVHANAGGIYSQIPSTCVGGCVASLLTGERGLMSLTGNYDLGSGSISEDGSDWLADTVFRGATTGFAYFNRLLSDDPAGVGAWNGSLPPSNGVYLIEDNITTSGDWTVAADQIFVLLADGDVTIGGNINVAPGGFLAVIASGSINIAPNVTNVEGVFIADGNLSTGSSNAQLRAEGIFTAWTTVNLQRDLDNDTVTPAELFVYRPDLQVNAYRYLLWMNINWREVAP